MLKVAVFSDTHSNTANMLRAVREYEPDVILHLGDHARDADVLCRDFPDIPLYRVCGNCDYGDNAPERKILKLGSVMVFLIHGHQYNVRWTLDYLVYAAQEAKAKVAFYGHTHEAEILEVGGVKLINPGTAGKGKRLTWASVSIYPNGGVTAEIHEFK